MDLGRKLLIGAFAANELVGFVRFTLCERLGLWWCRGLVVVVEWQRRGIGAALLKTLVDEGFLDRYPPGGLVAILTTPAEAS